MSKIKSFSLVAIREAYVREAYVAIQSIRKLWGDVPIYVYTDDFGCDFLRDLAFCENGFKKGFSRLKHFVQKTDNGHHCPLSIYAKMIAIEQAVSKYQETFFIDTDVLFLEKFDIPDAELILSPNYFKKEKFEDMYGKYNAGYLYVRKEGIGKFWANEYLKSNGFYEQQCMNKLARKYRVYTFNSHHNVGHWRKNTDINASVVSYHFHSIPMSYECSPDPLRGHYARHAKAVMQVLPEDIKSLIYDARNRKKQ